MGLKRTQRTQTHAKTPGPVVIRVEKTKTREFYHVIHK